MRRFIIFTAIWWLAASFSYAESVDKEKTASSGGMVLKTFSKTKTASDTQMYAKSKTASRKTKSSTSSTRSSSKKNPIF